MSDEPTFPAIGEADLLAYLDGAASAEIAATIEQSPALRQQAQQIARSMQQLTAQLYRHDCPDTLALTDYHTGQLAAREARAVKQHVAHCPHCAYELIETRAFLGAPVAAPSLYEQIKIALARRLSGWGPAADVQPALRGVADGPLLYETEDGVQIAIDIVADAPHATEKSLTGFVTGADVNALSVSLWRDGTLQTMLPVDEFGNFSAQGLANGSYELIVTGPELIIHIEALAI
jgi:hypothetical protein